MQPPLQATDAGTISSTKHQHARFNNLFTDLSLHFRPVASNSQSTNTMASPSPSRPSQGLIASQSRTSTPGLRYPSTKKTIYDRNLNRTKNAELSRAAFAYLFIEMINYAQRQVKGITDLEKRSICPRPLPLPR
jgi:hypothetical protein